MSGEWTKWVNELLEELKVVSKNKTFVKKLNDEIKEANGWKEVKEELSLVEDAPLMNEDEEQQMLICEAMIDKECSKPTIH